MLAKNRDYAQNPVNEGYRLVSPNWKCHQFECKVRRVWIEQLARMK
jgi:hypothetical protein